MLKTHEKYARPRWSQNLKDSEDCRSSKQFWLRRDFYRTAFSHAEDWNEDSSNIHKPSLYSWAFHSVPAFRATSLHPKNANSWVHQAGSRQSISLVSPCLFYLYEQKSTPQEKYLAAGISFICLHKSKLTHFI